MELCNSYGEGDAIPGSKQKFFRGLVVFIFSLNTCLEAIYINMHTGVYIYNFVCQG